MKRMIAFSLLLGLTQASHAVTLTCGLDSVMAPNEQEWSEDVDKSEYYSFGFTKLKFNCVSKKGYKFDLIDFQIGPELFDQANSGVKITCPFVSSEKLAEIVKANNNLLKFGGLHLSAGAIVAARAGVKVNAKVGACFMGSVGYGLGGGVGLDQVKLSFTGVDSNLAKKCNEDFCKGDGLFLYHRSEMMFAKIAGAYDDGSVQVKVGLNALDTIKVSKKNIFRPVEEFDGFKVGDEVFGPYSFGKIKRLSENGFAQIEEIVPVSSLMKLVNELNGFKVGDKVIFQGHEGTLKKIAPNGKVLVNFPYFRFSAPSRHFGDISELSPVE